MRTFWSNLPGPGVIVPKTRKSLVQIPGFQDSGIPGFQDSRIPGFQDSGIPGFQDSRIPGFQDSRIPGFQDSRIPGFQDSRIPGFKDSRIQGFQDSRIPGFQDSRIPGFQDSRIPGKSSETLASLRNKNAREQSTESPIFDATFGSENGVSCPPYERNKIWDSVLCPWDCFKMSS
jgi:hypothetical protein